LLVEKVNSNIKDYNLNNLVIEGRVYIKHSDKYDKENKVFRMKVEDDTLGLEIINSHVDVDQNKE